MKLNSLIKINRLSVIFALCLLVTTVANAAEPSPEMLNRIRWYKVYWLGLYVGDLVAQVKQEDERYYVETRMNSKGIAKTATKYWSVSHTKGHIRQDDFIPQEFFTQSRLRKNRSSIAVYYAQDGSIKEEVIDPPEHVGKRPLVSAELKQGTIDPLSAVLATRQKIKERVVSGATFFTVPMYEGKRRANLHVEIKGKVIEEFKGNKIPMISIRLRREAIAGFSNNELKRMKKEEPYIDVYLSDDEVMLPLRAYAEAPIGYATAILEKECHDIANCAEPTGTVTASNE